MQRKIERHLRKELARRMLNQYFSDTKSMEHLTEKVYPPALMDMTKLIPLLRDEVEIVPFVDEANITTGTITVGWNLFVRGLYRMFLGKTTHTNASELKQSIISGNPPTKVAAEVVRSAADVIRFVIRHGKFTPGKAVLPGNSLMPSSTIGSDIANDAAPSTRMAA